MLQKTSTLSFLVEEFYFVLELSFMFFKYGIESCLTEDREIGLVKMKCPVCSSKLSFDMKLKKASCSTCGWTKIFSDSRTRNDVRYASPNPKQSQSIKLVRKELR